MSYRSPENNEISVPVLCSSISRSPHPHLTIQYIYSSITLFWSFFNCHFKVCVVNNARLFYRLEFAGERFSLMQDRVCSRRKSTTILREYLLYTRIVHPDPTHCTQ